MRAPLPALPAQPLELPGFGDNPAPPCEDLAAYAQALLDMTEPGHAIMAVGVNALLVLHALQRRPGHFSRSVLRRRRVPGNAACRN